MVAAPFKVTMIVALGSPNGPRKQFNLTGSDVSAEFLLHPSGDSSIILNGKNDVYIVDIIYSAAGTDTVADEVFIGGQTTNYKVYRATSLVTTIDRYLKQAPIKVSAGMQIKFKQVTA